MENKNLKFLNNKMLVYIISFILISIIAVIAGDIVVQEGTMNIDDNLTVNSNVLFVDSANDRVGIGTTNPDSRLEVNQSGTTSAISVSGGTNPWIKITDGTIITKLQTKTGEKGIVGTDTNHNFEVRTNNIARMTFDTNGNVGIGTENPTVKFVVASGEIRFPSEGTNITHFNYASNNWNYIRGTTILADSGGKVGIGTQNPIEKLDVAGNVRADSYITYSSVFNGDALSILDKMEARENKGEWSPLAHTSLPNSIIKEYIEEGTCAEQNLPEDVECVDLGNGQSKAYGQSLTGMVAINSRALQQLYEENLKLKTCITSSNDFSELKNCIG